MLYMVYERFKADFLEAQEVYKQILDKKDELFNMTQPKSTRYDKERVSGGENVNSFEKYMILKERTDRKSTRLNSSHPTTSRMPSSA